MEGYNVTNWEAGNMVYIPDLSTSVFFLSGLMIAILYSLRSPKYEFTSRKAKQTREMREAYKLMERTKGNRKLVENEPSMKITELWVYPIKSLQGCKVDQALLTQEGFYVDRRFMLLKVDEETPRKLSNMQISTYSTMCLFYTSISGETLTVTFRPPGSFEETIEIPLEPDFQHLERVGVDMYSSATKGYDMGEKYNDWFSKHFGFRVILAFWGGNPRPVLGNLPGKPANQGPKPKNAITNILSSFPIIGPLIEGDNDVIAFNDCAPYLVIQESSVANVTARLPDGVSMDATKFRANIILKSSAPAFSEDYWGELTFEEDTRIVLTGNCARCKSLNVDYATGKDGTGKDGEVLKLLQKDRRVDLGNKYSPVFGRYGFVGKGGEGRVLRVGDKVSVSKTNEERTRFYWPGLSTD